MAITLLSSVLTGDAAGDHKAVTSANIDTSGADLLVVVVTGYDATNTPVVTDSKNNHTTPGWTARTKYSSTNGYVQIFYCVPSSVGTGHNFTVTTSGDSYPAIAAFAFSGAHATPYDGENGANSSSATSLAPGSVTPGENDCVLVTGLMAYTRGAATVPTGYTGHVAAYVASNYLSSGAAYKIQTSAGAENPSWSWSGSDQCAANIAVFKSAAGGGGGGTLLPFLTNKRANRMALVGGRQI